MKFRTVLQKAKKCKHALVITLCAVIIEKIYTFMVITKFENPASSQLTALSSLNEIELTFWIVLIGPLIETAFFQSLVIESSMIIFPKKMNIHLVLAITFSTCAFSLSHSFSETFKLLMLFPGLIFSLVYVISKSYSLNGFILTFTTHSLSNTISLVINNLNH